MLSTILTVLSSSFFITFKVIKSIAIKIMRSTIIIRGILTAESSMMIPTIVGLALAGVVAYYKSNLVLSVATAILASFLIINLM